MKKLMVVLLVLIVLAGAWYVWRERWGAKPLPALRAMMHDEDAPRAVEPSVGLQVNDAAEATVFVGTPLWLTVGVDNPSAVNAASAARARSKKKAAPAQRAPAGIALGDAGRPWTAAIEFMVAEGKGGGQRLPATMPVLGKAPEPVELDAVRTTEANLGVAATGLAPGRYPIQACLGQTGSWKGRVCSGVVKLTIVARPAQLSPEQELAVAQQTGRFGLRAGDQQALDTAGRRMLEADAGSIPGHMYSGEAKYLRGEWKDALAEFTAARREFERRHPGSFERPRALTARIAQVMEKMEGEGSR